MLRNLFKKKNPVMIEDFLLNIKEDKEDILSVLSLRVRDFKEASQDELFSNPDDLACGVNRLLKKFDSIFFGLFENMLIKLHDSGEVKYIFYTQTTDINKIIEIADCLFNIFGEGIYDDRKHTSFRNKEKIISLSRGKYFSSKDELVHLWLFGKFSIVLQYRLQPLRQFVLSISENKESEIDRTVRTKGTILDLLKVDPTNLLQANEIDKEIRLEDGAISFIDYFFKLDDEEFGEFDTVVLRFFDSEREFSKDIQTHLTLYSSDIIQYSKMISIAEKLIDMYGEDDIGTGPLEIHDMEAMEEDFWSGRRWTFNENHGLWNMDDDNEEMSYTVSVDYDENNNGFEISILGYNRLLDLFGSK